MQMFQMLMYLFVSCMHVFTFDMLVAVSRMRFTVSYRVVVSGLGRCVEDSSRFSGLYIYIYVGIKNVFVTFVQAFVMST